MGEVLITQIGLSNRAIRVLQRMKINTLTEFVNTPISSVQKQRGVGFKTIEELTIVQNQIASGKIIVETSSYEEDASCDELSNIPEIVIEQFEQYPISVLDLSTRSKNGLLHGGIINMKQLIKLTDEGINSLPNIGRQSSEEIKVKRQEWLKSNPIIDVTINRNTIMPKDKEEVYIELSLLLQKIVPYGAEYLYGILEERLETEHIRIDRISDLTPEGYSFMFNNIEEIHECLEQYIRSWFSDKRVFLNEDDLTSRIEDDFDNEALKKSIRSFLDESNILEQIDSFYVLKRQKLDDYLRTVKSDKRMDIVIDRLDGASLQEIGDKNNLTKERVRQITTKIIAGFPLLEEDYYAEAFEYFWFNRERFYRVFPNENKRTYDYLAVRYKKGKAEIEKEEIDGFIGLYSSTILDHVDLIEIDRMKKRPTRQAIAWRVLIMHDDEYYDIESFKEAYERFLNTYELDKDKYSINNSTLKNLFRNSPHVVFNKNAGFRYYENEADSLWEKIDFDRYNNLVISAELIFNDYIDLMEEYDIRNGYELFCLLKNTEQNRKKEYMTKELVFRRIPIMIVGNGNEEKQVVKLVKELSPIECGAFFEAYEERFGVKKETAASNLGRYIEKYQANGKYYINLPRLAREDERIISRILHKKQIWSIGELEKVFDENCQYSEKDCLNATTLYELGFSLNVGYAYNKKYGSGTECIEKSVFSGDIVDVNNIDIEISKLSIYRNYLYQLRFSMEYFEISPKMYASKYLLQERYGLTEEGIIGIQKVTSRYYSDKYFNSNSLWNRIKDDPNVKLLQDNKWLCTSIIRQQEFVFALPITGAVVLSLQREELSLSNICTWVVEQEGKMTLERLTDRINELFGSSLDKRKVAFKIKENKAEGEILVDGVDEYIEQLVAEADTYDDDLFREEFY